MRRIKVLLCLLPGLVFTKTMGQIYEEPNTGNVGIGTTTIDNVQGWIKVLQLYGPFNSKLLVTSNNGPKVGLFSHNGFNGKIGTESNHDLTLTAGYWNDVMTLTTAGKVGIGTTSPGAKLSFNNVDDGTNGPDGITWYNLSPLVYGIHRTAGAWAAPNYQQLRLSWETGLIIDPGTQFGKSYVDIQGAGLRVTSGNVGIGTTDTRGYKLAVAGNMIAESIKVQLQSGWPDYVFAKSYELPTLHETEKYIKENGHLPNIPSAGEVRSNGIDLGEMNAKLLEKIEELTLYMIEVKKENEKLSNRIKQLELKK